MNATECEVDFDVRSLPGMINLDVDRIELAKQRQTAVWRGEKPDKWPIIWGGWELTPEQETIPNPNYREAFYDSNLMLCSQIRNVCVAANSDSDVVPSIRANMGTGIILACLGLEQEVFTDKMPWVKKHLTKAEITKIELDDIVCRGSFELGMKHMRRFREIIGDTISIYCMDHQGPFDLAHLLLGDDIFLEIYDDPTFVNHLLTLCVELSIKTITWMKEFTGESTNNIHHSNSLYAENMGIRICEDTTAIVGPDTINNIIMPHTRRLARHFGGAWAHYCGRNDHLTEALCRIPEIRGINFGHVPGHVYDHPFEEDMQRCLDNKKVYYGNWPRFKNETGRQYLQRLHFWADQGCLIPNCDGVVGKEDGLFNSGSEAAEYWYSL